MVNLDSSAGVRYVQVPRDVPALTESSLVAINQWTFAPAKLDQQAWPADLPLDIVFNPEDLIPQSIPLPPPATQSEPHAPLEFTPPVVLEARYAAYPEHSDAYGTLVLDVTVDKLGRADRVSVVRSRSESLTKPVVAAVKRWKFKPGSLHGAPVISKIVIAFVFPFPTYPSA